MVRLYVKKGDESQFVFETNLNEEIEKVLGEVVAIYNGRLKVKRICDEFQELSKHGTALPPNMQGLTDEQIEELKLDDEWGENCVTEGFSFNRDPIGKRNGWQPNKKLQEVLEKTSREALALISIDLLKSDTCLNLKMIGTAFDMLRGAIMITYPMGLPPYDPIKLELENCEDLTGTQASLEVMDFQRTSLWFCGKELKITKKLGDYLGKNEKSKVIVKLQKSGQGPPGREPAISAEEHKAIMMMAHRRQQELQTLDENLDNEYLNSEWADSTGLRKVLHGLEQVRFKPK